LPEKRVASVVSFLWKERERSLLKKEKEPVTSSGSPFQSARGGQGENAAGGKKEGGKKMIHQVSAPEPPLLSEGKGGGGWSWEWHTSEKGGKHSRGEGSSGSLKRGGLKKDFK